MFAVMPSIGIALIAAGVRLRAGGRLDADLCALWGGIGALLVLAEALPPVRGLLSGLKAETAWMVLVFWPAWDFGAAWNCRPRGNGGGSAVWSGPCGWAARKACCLW